MEEEQKIDFAKIEKKWQDRWESEKVFEVGEDPKKKKYYVLEMFPYPSAEGLHMGHAFNFTIGDVFTRFKRMQGFNVMHPVGFDSLGLPAENAAIKAGKHPEDYTNNSIKNFMKQEKALGLAYDWSRQVNTADSEYYRWDQWIFLKMFEKGLVYEKEAAVNWCNKCNTIISNEQAQGGECDRCGTKIEIKQMKQWFLKITDYADRLLEGHKNLKWPEKTIAMQKNWIGKSYGTEIDFEINNKKWPVFTTRPDTVFGITFMVISAQHKNLMELVTKEQKKEVEKFLNKVKSVSEKELADMEKEGVFTGSYAINPATGDKVPVYAGNFVVADYGGGMVMAVPAHDQRDFEFAKKYKIPIKQVITEINEDYTPLCKVRTDKKTIKRDSVVCVLKHWSEDKYLCLNWKNINWHTPVTGGIEDGETPEETGMREIKEETGYQNAEFLGRGLDVVGYYYHPKKDINRFEKQTPLFFKLKDGKQLKLSEEEKAKHELVWVEKSKVEKFLNHDEKNYDARVALHVWSQYLNPRAVTNSGVLINSKEFDGISNDEAKKKISDWLISQNRARKVINYKLRDWSVARQRYWGTPIPLIHCEKCGIVPVPEKELPVKLPKEVKFGIGNPLLTNESWLNVKCPKCNGKARREANTMDTFVNSSWYFLRYCDPHNNEKIFNKEKVKYWMPVDLYVGGAEHACMHLIYARFYTMFLHDIGLIDFEEPAPRLFHQGMINDEKGEKMSKSKGNVIEPLETMAKYGVDATRFFLLSEASPDKGFNWSDKGIQGSTRIINKIWKIGQEVKFGKDSEEMQSKINKTIKNVTEQIENIDYRKSTIEIRELFDLISKQTEISKESFEKAIKLISPFCPHIAEELWERLGNKDFISTAEWPKYGEIKKSANQENVNDKIIANVKPVVDKIIATQKVEKIYLYVMPFEIKQVNKDKIEKVLGRPTQIFAVNDPKKHDPENKAKKALPGKPGVFVE